MYNNTTWDLVEWHKTWACSPIDFETTPSSSRAYLCEFSACHLTNQSSWVKDWYHLKQELSWSKSIRFVITGSFNIHQNQTHVGPAQAIQDTNPVKIHHGPNLILCVPNLSHFGRTGPIPILPGFFWRFFSQCVSKFQLVKFCRSPRGRCLLVIPNLSKAHLIPVK